MKRIMNYLKYLFSKIINLFKKKEQEIIVPPEPKSVEEIKKDTAEKELKDKVNKINELAKKNGVLSCYKCGKASGLYKLTLRKRLINNPKTNKPIKVYVCNYCEGEK